MGNKTTTGKELIANERERQISKEGWTIEHDDAHTDGSLAKAADCYFEYADDNDYTDTKVHLYWPWDKTYWKPKNQLSDYTRAGALYLAELQRLERIGGAVGQQLTNLRIGIRQCEIRIDDLLTMTPTNPTTPAVKSKEEILNECDNHIGPHYQKEDVLEAMELYATQQQSIATGEIKSQVVELLDRERIFAAKMDNLYADTIEKRLYDLIQVIEALPQPPTKVKGETE